MANEVVTRRLQIIIDESGAEKALERLTAQEKKLVHEIEKGTKAGKDMTAQLEKLDATKSKISQLEGVISGKLTPSIRQTEAAVRKLHHELQSMSQDAPGYAQKLASFKEANAQLASMKQNVTGFRAAANSVFSQIKTVALGVTVGNTITAITQSIGSFISGAISGAAKLSDEIADIEKATDKTTKQVEALNGQLGKLNTRTANSELRQLAVSLGQAGEEVNLENIKALDQINVALGDEFGGNVKEIGDNLSVLRNNLQDIKTGNYAEDVTHIGNALNELGANGLATAPVVSDIANRIAGVGQTFGVTSGEILGTAAAFQELGINVERGSTAYTKLLQKMAGDTETFAKVAGMELKEFQELVNTDINEALLRVAKGSKEASQSNVAFAKTLSDLESSGAGVSELLAKLAANGDLVRGKIDLATESLKGNSSIISEFEKKNNTLGAEFEKLSKKMSSAFNSPALRSGLANLLSGFNSLFESGNKANRAFDEQAEKMGDLDKAIDPLLARYDQLNGRTDLNIKEQEELRKIINQIVDLIPEAISGFDEYGNVLDINREKIGQYVEANQQFKRELEASAIDSLQEDVQESQKLITDLTAAIEINNNAAKNLGADQGEYYRKLNVGYIETLRKTQVQLIEDAETLRDKYGIELPAALENAIYKIKQLRGDKEVIADASQFDIFPNGNPKDKKTTNTTIVDEDALKKRADTARREAERRRKELEDLLRDLEKLERGIRLDAINDEYLRALEQLSDKYDDFFTRTRGNIKLTERALVDFVAELQNVNRKFAEIEPPAPADTKSITERIDAEAKAAGEAMGKREALNKAEIDLLKKQAAEKLKITIENVRARIAAEIKLLELQRDAEKAALPKGSDLSAFTLIDQKYQNLIDNLNNESKNLNPLFGEDWLGDIDTGLSYAYDAVQSLNSLLQALDDNRLNAIRSKNEEELNQYQSLLDNKLISQKEYDRRVNESNRKADAESKKIQQEAFKRNKAISLATAIINVAGSVVNAALTVPYIPAGLAATVAAAAAGAVQIATIAASKPSFAKGGYVPDGSSHAEGGIGIRDNRTGKYLGTMEGGEPIISKPVYQANKPLVDSLLQKGWSRDYTPITPGWMSSKPRQLNIPLINQSVTARPRFAEGGISPEADKAMKRADNTEDLLQLILQAVREPKQAFVVYGEYEVKAEKINNIRDAGTIA